MKNKPLIAVVGETASGKSSLAMEIARKHNGAIISADSRAIYKGMDIGTAKPSQKDQAEIPHFGIDLVEPNQPFNAALFKAHANEAIIKIHKQDKLPILVGGTGLYVDAVLFNYDFGGDNSTRTRSELNQKSTAELVKFAKSQKIDVSNQMMQNKRHLIRHIERKGNSYTKSNLRHNTLMIGLQPKRHSLRYNIEQRVEVMFRSGLRPEVDGLVKKYSWENEAMTGIGYREFKPYYEGLVSMSEVKRAIVKNTLGKLAKHQRTWFKRNQNIEWFEESDKAMERVDSWLKDAYS